MADSISPTVGFVAFCDILGYRQLLEHNEIGPVIDLLRKKVAIIPNLPDRIFGRPLSEFGDRDRDAVTILTRLNWLLFSDSILVTLPVSNRDVSARASTKVPYNPSKSEAALFFFVVARLFFEMFSNGLPLRGAIQLGEFHVEPPFFAGAAISQAYGFANNQEWAGCALMPAAAKRVEELFNGDHEVGHSVPMFDVPTKAGTIRTRAINWGFWAPWNYPYVSGVLREAVMESFLSHQKSLGQEVFPKLDNTEAFLVHCKMSARTLHPGPWTPLVELTRR